MIQLVHREDDGAVRFDDLAEKFKAKFAGTSQWPLEAWIIFLAKGGGPKKRKFSVLLEPKFFQTFPCISEQSRDIQEVLSLILHCKTMYCYWMTSPSTSTTSVTLTTCTPSSWVDWFQEEKSQNGQESEFFHSREPDVRQSRSGRSSRRSGQIQNYSVQ